ncbi:hypothetical protein GF366_03110 [Candidatus Peregrinibacteria bacterium]|nr:hypothetical protein [Candidatus Peregrinibacteria bacterium]
MDFESAGRYLKMFVSYEDMPDFDYDESNFDLERVRNFFENYGIDYSKIKFIHVAGSKGKGTVCNFIASYLKVAGHKTGLFSSPYILSIKECFQVNGENISEDDFAGYVEDLKKHIDSAGGCSLTYFELLFVLVMKFFVDEGVEYAVLEVGLGGRLDATNIIIPELSVLTAVEKEHTNVLGTDLSTILDEKLGIVKKGVPLLVGDQSGYVKCLIKEKMSRKIRVFFVEDFDSELEDLDLKSANSALIKNAETAFSALKILLESVDKKVFKRIFDDFEMIGRFDIKKINGKIVVFDIAHTKLSIINLIKSLETRFPDKRYVFLVSVMRGKDVLSLIEEMSKTAEKIIFTSSHNERGYKGKELEAFSSGVYSEVIEGCEEAFRKTLENLGRNQVLIVTGSHFLVSKLLKII